MRKILKTESEQNCFERPGICSTCQQAQRGVSKYPVTEIPEIAIVQNITVVHMHKK